MSSLASLISVFIVLLVSVCGHAAVWIQMGDLQDDWPKPPNPVKVYGWVSSILTGSAVVSDGVRFLEVAGLTSPRLGQFVVVEGSYDPSTQLLTSANSTVEKRAYPRVLFIGDSITWSMPGQWNNDREPGWGMAASCLEEDFVTRTTDLIRAYSPSSAACVFTSHSVNQRAGRITDMVEKLPEFRALNADLIIIQGGENDKGKVTTYEYSLLLEELIDGLLCSRPQPRIVLLGIWDGGGPYTPGTWWGDLDGVSKAVADSRRIPFASLKEVAQDPCSFDNRFDFIGWHPNDHGMSRIAQQAFQLVYPEL